MRDLCFLLDENLSPVIKRELLKVEPKMIILRVGDKGAPPLGTADEVILEWLQESGFILVTDNRKSMPEHLKKPLCAWRTSPRHFSRLPWQFPRSHH